MHKRGHAGFALLAYLPVLAVGTASEEWSVLTLIGVVALADIARPVALLTGWNLSLSLAMLPDIDQQLPQVTHRGFTHTIWFVLTVSLCGAGLGFLLATVFPIPGGVASPAMVGLFCGYLCVHALGTHLLADVVTPMGLRPLWPVSDWHVSLNLLRAANPTANRVLYLMGVSTTVILLVAIHGFPP